MLNCETRVWTRSALKLRLHSSHHPKLNKCKAVFIGFCSVCGLRGELVSLDCWFSNPSMCPDRPGGKLVADWTSPLSFWLSRSGSRSEDKFLADGWSSCCQDYTESLGQVVPKAHYSRAGVLRSVFVFSKGSGLYFPPIRIFDCHWAQCTAWQELVLCK